MKHNDDFYIGWKDEISSNNWKFLRKYILLIMLVLPILALVLVAIQNEFTDHNFELGKTTKITGTFYSQPFPMLIALDGELPMNLSREILMVGYGKFGAEGIIKKVEEQSGALDGKLITVEGTLIYGDGKTLLELTNKEKSILNIGNNSKETTSSVEDKIPITLRGEIIDPKCYFGVMKPGEGKIHKSCAIRCISGGIPPVFKHAPGGSDQRKQYYLLLDNEEKVLNEKILSFVAEEVRIEGFTHKKHGWDILYCDPESISLVSNQ